MIDEEKLAKWERITSKAFRGSWRVSKARHNWMPFSVLCRCSEGDAGICEASSEEDAEFIAASREAVPALIVEVRELQHRLDQATSHAEDCCAEVARLEQQRDWLADTLAGISQCVKRFNIEAPCNVGVNQQENQRRVNETV